jgi:formyl transferase-like protein
MSGRADGGRAGTVSFGAIDRVALLGGSWLTGELCRRLAGGPFSLVLFAGLRHLDGAVDATGTTLRTVAERAGVPHVDTDDINREPRLGELVTEGTLGIALGAPWVFAPDVVARFGGRLLDFMGIPLPQYRGGAHYCWQILQGTRRGACHLQVIHGGTETFHRGPVVKSRDYLFPAGARTPQDYFDASVPTETAFLLEFLDEVARGAEFVLQPLQETFSTYFPFLSTPRHGYIDWRWSTDEIERFICAFDRPYRGASSFLAEDRVFLRDCHAEYVDGSFHPFHAGLVYRTTADALYIATRDGAIVARHLEDEHGRAMRDRVRAGQRLVTPQSVLEAALRFDAVYDARGLVETAPPVAAGGAGAP